MQLRARYESAGVDPGDVNRIEARRKHATEDTLRKPGGSGRSNSTARESDIVGLVLSVALIGKAVIGEATSR